jgi:hypothetical protein
LSGKVIPEQNSLNNGQELERIQMLKLASKQFASEEKPNRSYGSSSSLELLQQKPGSI